LSLAQQYLGDETKVIALLDPSRVDALFYRILEVGEKRGRHASIIASSLVLPLLLMINQENQDHRDVKNLPLQSFTRCKMYIENHWKTIKSISEVPIVFNMSQPYMNKLFKTFGDGTPHQYLLKCKMSYAYFEIQQNHRKVYELANELGFSDAYSFSKTFKRIVGKAPSKVR
jgi:AraC-like DNA-binding protein